MQSLSGQLLPKVDPIPWKALNFGGRLVSSTITYSHIEMCLLGSQFLQPNHFNCTLSLTRYVTSQLPAFSWSVTSYDYHAECFFKVLEDTQPDNKDASEVYYQEREEHMIALLMRKEKLLICLHFFGHSAFKLYTQQGDRLVIVSNSASGTWIMM